jgi:hypothetical protein
MNEAERKKSINLFLCCSAIIIDIVIVDCSYLKISLTFLDEMFEKVTRGVFIHYLPLYYDYNIKSFFSN